MAFKKNNLNKEIANIKSDLKEMMLNHQRKIDKETKLIYEEASKNLTQLIIKGDDEILEEVKQSLAKEKEKRDNRSQKVVNFLSDCKSFLTKNINVGIFKVRNDTNNLDRFIDAQDKIYPYILQEIRNGKKTSHWMWFIFPQLAGLGKSDISQQYAIKDINEAWAYLEHPILNKRLRECCITLLTLPMALSSIDIFGQTDSKKLRSSITLFYLTSENNEVFFTVLERFFNSTICKKTESILTEQSKTIIDD